MDGPAEHLHRDVGCLFAIGAGWIFMAGIHVFNLVSTVFYLYDYS